MQRMYLIEGTPGVGKTSFIKNQLADGGLLFGGKLVYSGDVVPENMVRREIKRGRKLTIQEARAIYRERPYAQYKEEHYERWEQFCQRCSDNNRFPVIDAGFMQSPLYELIGLYQLPPEQLLEHFQGILSIIQPRFSPQLIYIRSTDPVACAQKALLLQQQQRGDWVRGFCRWLEIAPYTYERKYSGIPGIMQFISDRYQVDQYLLDQLPVDILFYDRNTI